jgi:hypothetical protein
LKHSSKSMDDTKLGTLAESVVRYTTYKAAHFAHELYLVTTIEGTRAWRIS